jgi:hypothetical protein
MLERLCERLAADWEVEGAFTTDVDGVWSIPLGDTMEIILTEIEGGFLMNTLLAPAPRERREDFFSLLMAATMLGHETRGAVLSLDEKERVVLSQVVTRSLQPREFAELIEDFITVVDQWKDLTVGAT